jgi:enamine deaminase RidA (YjgF/YER057c/UK114 family)
MTPLFPGSQAKSMPIGTGSTECLKRSKNMTGQILARLGEMGIDLPEPAAPVANYIPAIRSGNLLFISGQLPIDADGQILTGKLGATTEVEGGVAAARICAINLIAQCNAALGDLDRIVRCVKLTGFVNCTPDFADHAPVINGGSGLMVDVLGDRGRHARAAVGCASLPLNAAVEIEGVFEVN